MLVVDDEPSNLASLEKIFQREGMRVLTAESAKDALELVRTHRVHVVLTDLMMPGTTGSSCCARSSRSRPTPRSC